MSKKVLNILSSPRGEDSVSKKLGNAVVAKILEKYPNSIVKENNLVANPAPNLNELQINGLFIPAENHSVAQKETFKYSDAAITELQDADIIVMNAPLYEFSITSMLKAYLDQIVRVGVTFKYGENGIPVGFVTGKKLYLVVASGGVYSEGALKDYDFVVPYLTKLLGFIGITDISVIRAEGLSKGTDEDKIKSYQKGLDSIVID